MKKDRNYCIFLSPILISILISNISKINVFKSIRRLNINIRRIDKVVLSCDFMFSFMAKILCYLVSLGCNVNHDERWLCGLNRNNSLTNTLDCIFLRIFVFGYIVLYRLDWTNKLTWNSVGLFRSIRDNLRKRPFSLNLFGWWKFFHYIIKFIRLNQVL